MEDPEHRLSPLVGEHTVEILLEYGYSREEIDALLARKVVGVYAKE